MNLFIIKRHTIKRKILRKAAIKILFFILYSNLSHSNNDTIPTKVSVDFSFCIKNRHKIIVCNKTIKTAGVKESELVSSIQYKKLNKWYLNEFKNDSAGAIFLGDLDHLQYIVNNGDTINFFDANGKRQGWFILDYLPSNVITNDKSTLDNLIRKSPFSSYYYFYAYYKNDKVIEKKCIGTKSDCKTVIDTIDYMRMINDTVRFNRYKVDAELYNEIYLLNGVNKNGRLNDTLKTFYKTGQLYMINTSGGSLLNYGKSTVWWENGHVKFYWNFVDGLKEGDGYAYREDGTLKFKFFFKKGIREKTICYDLRGKKVIECDPEELKKIR